MDIKSSLWWSRNCNYYYSEKKHEIVFINPKTTFYNKRLQAKHFLLYNISIDYSCYFSKILHKWKILFFLEVNCDTSSVSLIILMNVGQWANILQEWNLWKILMKLQKTFAIRSLNCTEVSTFFISFFNLLTVVVVFSFTHTFLRL